MLDIVFHIAVLIVVVFAVGIFAFHHSLYDYLLGSMKGAIKEKTVTTRELRLATPDNKQPPRLIKRKESDFEKALKNELKEPAGSTSERQ